MFFAPQRPELRPKPEENGHEEEGLVGAEAPVADRGEYPGLSRCLSEMLQCKLDRPEKEGWRAHGRVSAAPEKCRNVCLLLTANLQLRNKPCNTTLSS